MCLKASSAKRRPFFLGLNDDTAGHHLSMVKYNNIEYSHAVRSPNLNKILNAQKTPHTFLPTLAI